MAQRTRTIAVDVDAAQASSKKKMPQLPWQMIAVLSAVAVAFAGWIVFAGLAALVWLGTTDVDLTVALSFATNFFALGHGASVDVFGQAVSVMPLGMGLLQIFLGLPLVRRAARAMAPQEDAELQTWTVAGAYAGAYVSAVFIISAIGADGGTAVRTLAGAALIGLVSGLFGASGVLGWDPTEAWTPWLRMVPRAISAALLVLFAIASVVFAIAVWFSRDRVVALTASLEPDLIGGIALAMLHVVYLPNFVLWTVSWLLGAGVTLGDGSAILLTATDVGFLPSIPVFAVVPASGVNSAAMLWWLVAGVVAGAAAGLAVVWGRPRARFDETALVGGLAGVLAGLLVALFAGLATGGLGVDRLAVVGAKTGELAVFAPSLLGLSGMAAGLLLGLIRKPVGTITPETVDEN